MLWPRALVGFAGAVYKKKEKTFFKNYETKDGVSTSPSPTAAAITAR